MNHCRTSRRRWLLAAFGCLVLCVDRPVGAAEANPYAQKLEGKVERSSKGVKEYLRHLDSDEARIRAGQLVEQLGSSEFATREQAMRQLLNLPFAPLAELQAAADDFDPEVRWRARLLLAQVKGKGTDVLLAVLRTIELDQISGAAAEVLNAIGFCSAAANGDNPSIRSQASRLTAAARAALVATSTKDDLALLREALAGDDPHVRRAAAAALGRIQGGENPNEIAALFKDEDAWVRLEAALVLGNVGDRRALSALASLLGAGELHVRLQAYQALRGLTGQNLAFTAYDDDARTAQASAWQTWVAEHGAQAPLSFPIQVAHFELGRTLVSDYQSHRVVEYDADGKKIWEVSGDGQTPFGVCGTLSGHRLVCWYSSKMVIEYDAEGKEIWRKENLPDGAAAISRAADGQTLICCVSVRKVFELSPNGEITGELEVPGQPCDAQRLDNGNTLVALYDENQVVEMNAVGEVVWELSGLKSPRSTQRLPNGHTMVAESGGRIVEFDADKNEVWSRSGLGQINDAQRLPDGNTLVSSNTGVRAIDKKGSVVWAPKDASIRRAGGICRY